MTRFGKVCSIAGIALVAACNNVTINNVSLDNQVDVAANHIENFAEGAANAADIAGGAIENQADSIGNKVHVHVDLDDHGN
ncbi:MAG: hypothetical protein JWO25_3335, partial [Alphaproteobacteria bacterium]|nr:hypothetical protein [Alphaproteobacteria bacterium]